MRRLTTMTALVAMVATAPAAVIFQNDFESGLATGFSAGPVNSAPNASTKFLGEFAADTTNLNLSGIGTHSMVTIDLDLFIIHSWDGNGELGFGPDALRIRADGSDLLNATFSNWSPTQSYSDATPLGGGSFAAKTGADAIGTLGFGDYFGTDTTYHLSFSFAHAADDLTFSFEGMSSQGLSDESWGIDNVVVSANSVPEPMTMAVLGLGVVPFMRRRRR